MIIAILTKSTGMLGPIANLLGVIMNVIYNFFAYFGIQNIALSIVMFTLITKLLMLPLTIKQQRFTKLSSKMNPELQEIQAKYKGKKDEASMRMQQEETQGIYKKYGASPMAGCLPMLITLPILFALYKVINNVPAHVTSIKVVYENIATAISGSEGYVGVLTEMASTMAVNTSKFAELSEGIMSSNHIIDILSKFKSEDWNQLVQHLPNIKNVVNDNLTTINHANKFFGLNIANNAGWRFPGVIIPLLAMGLQIIQTKQMTKGNEIDKNDPTASAMGSMNTVMPIMSGVFAVMMPIGLGIYWIANSCFTIVQQFFVDLYLDKTEDNTVIENVPNKNNNNNNKNEVKSEIKDIAKKSTKVVESDKKKSNINKTSYSTGSISDIANIMKNRDKGDK